ncbi:MULTISPECIES: hypothetical protein [Marinomonas]|uniref:hypothetical protein n=1 Tax=Marinomonas TaxID=28253 RepID=UPI00140555BD|nr:hypothetical protein [Marinomonas sp. KMM3893]
MKAALSQGDVDAALDEYQCLFLRSSLGSLSKPEPQTKKRQSSLVISINSRYIL